MRLLHRVVSLFRTFFRGRQLDRELDDELRAYLDHQIATRIAGGADPAEARRHVLIEEGGIEPIKEHTRRARIGFGFATVLQDLRYGWRAMWRAPGFAVVACLTLAIGIGASITMFTVMRSVLWRPLPYPASDRLVVIEVDARGVRNVGAAMGEVRDLRERSRTLELLAIINAVAAHVDVDGEVDGLGAANVSDDLLPALGIVPVLGRTLDARLDAGQPAARGVLISDALWHRRFGRDPGVIGRVVTINNLGREIVGVLPPDFNVFLPESIGTLEHTDVWFSTGIGDDRDYRGAGVLGRLAPTFTLADARREVEALAAQFAAEHPSVYRDAAVRFRVREVREALTENVHAGLRALGLAVAFVLLVSCVNVANLMLARSAGRTRELAVRRALGAGRARLVRQLVTESLLLSAIGSGLGLLLGRWGIDALEWLRPTHLPRQSQISMDMTVVGFAIGITAAAGLLFGALPALRLVAGKTHAPAPGRGDTAGRGSRRVQRTLVIAEIALSIVPLIAAGLMLRSFVNLTNARLGFQPEGVLSAQMPISFRQFPDFDARWRLHTEAFGRVRTIPGVEAVSAASPLPFGPLQITRRYGRAGDGAPSALATLQSVLPGYLRVVGTRVIQGRDFTNEDLAERRQVVVVDARIAKALWPSGAIGQRLALASSQRVSELEVVGVTEPVRTRQVRDDSTPHVFVPYHVFSIEMALVIRTQASPAAIGPSIKRAIASLGTGRAVDVQPLQDFVRNSIAETRFTMLVLSGFAAAALLLAAIGLYGTLAYLTSQRSREFGVRLALGATRRQILRLVAREGLGLTAIGAAIGIAGALTAAQWMRRLLYEVEPLDPLTLLGVAALVSGLASAACIRPAWSAASVDPTSALRAD